MNNYTENDFKEQLEQLASIEPGENSLRQMNQSVRSIISGAGRKPRTAHSFFYYAAASAAMLLVGMSVLYDSNPTIIPPKTRLYTQSESTLTLAKLNSVFNNGGQKALDEYFEKIESNRQPRAETITLQEIMKEL